MLESEPTPTRRLLPFCEEKGMTCIVPTPQPTLNHKISGVVIPVERLPDSKDYRLPPTEPAPLTSYSIVVTTYERQTDDVVAWLDETGYSVNFNGKYLHLDIFYKELIPLANQEGVARVVDAARVETPRLYDQDGNLITED